MRRSALATVGLFVLLPYVLTAAPAAEPPVTVEVDWPAFIGRHDLVWDALPGEFDYGAFLGNGMLGTMIHQDGPQRLRWEMGRSDVTEHRRDNARLLIGVDVSYAKSHRHWSHILMVHPLHIMTGDQPEECELLEMKTLRPLTHLSPRSRLIEIAASGKHHDVKVTGADLETLITWVDCNVPYLGEEEIRQMPDRAGPDWTPQPRLATAPVIDRFNITQDGGQQAEKRPQQGSKINNKTTVKDQK